MGQKNPFPYISARHQGYVDHFSDMNSNKEPVVLEDGTSVIFPSGWTDEDADKWRKGMELRAPEGLSAVSQSLSDLFVSSDRRSN